MLVCYGSELLQESVLDVYEWFVQTKLVLLVCHHKRGYHHHHIFLNGLTVKTVIRTTV